jgi:ribosomal protein S18 acetylase RimI-like enzyme
VTDDVARRAKRWRLDDLEAVCDVVEAWEHGTVMKAPRYPTYYDYNVVWVDGDPGLRADELIAVADEHLGEYEHRRLDFASADAGERVRAALAAARWEATRLLWMRHSGELPAGPSTPAEEVDYDAVLPLRRAWHGEDFADLDSTGYLANARELAMTRDVQVIATREGDELVGYAQVVRADDAAEISQVYVRPEYRGSGRGTAITRAAIEAAGDVGDLWIVADDEDRPKQLYSRLGFRPVWTSIEFLRAPGVAGWTG